MKPEYNFYVGFKDVEKNLKVKNSSLLTFFENIAGMHSSMVGDGLLETLTKTHATWLLVSWDVKVISRPEYGESVTVKTWVKSFKRIYSDREFEVYSQSGELKAVAASRWVHIDTEKNAPARVDDTLAQVYTTEDVTNFPELFSSSLKEPEGYSFSYTHTVGEDWIDMNYHMNNTRYLTLAEKALKENNITTSPFDKFSVLYKKEIKENEKVVCLISENEDSVTVTVKSEKKDILHAVIRLFKY